MTTDRPALSACLRGPRAGRRLSFFLLAAAVGSAGLLFGPRAVAQGQGGVAVGVPGAAPPGVATPPPANAPPAAPATDDARDASVRRGLVAVEHGGRLSGVGVVLGTDGRVLTALSALGGATETTVKLPDGRNAKAKVGHKDAASDLALLILENAKWTEGLRASEVDPMTIATRAVVSPKPGKATTMPVTLRGRLEGLAGLGSAFDVEVPKGASALAGAPLLDDKGNVLGVFVRACRPVVAQGPAAPATGAFGLTPVASPPATPPVDAGAPKAPKCAPTWAVAPVSALRSFLTKTPAEAVAKAPWLGIAGESATVGTTAGVRVLAVAPQSPAERAGLKGPTDRAKAILIVAVDGTPVATPERLAELIAGRTIGETVKLLVLDGERLREIAVTLKAAP